MHMDLSKCFHNKAFFKKHFFLKNCLSVTYLCDTLILTYCLPLHPHHGSLMCHEHKSRNDISTKGFRSVIAK